MYYVLDENNNRQEAYSKEEILSVLAQAIADGTLANISADAGFITKLKCACTGTTVKEAFVTQEQYNSLAAAGTEETNTLYNIIDDTTLDDIEKSLENLNTGINENKASLINLTDKLPLSNIALTWNETSGKYEADITNAGLYAYLSINSAGYVVSNGLISLLNINITDTDPITSGGATFDGSTKKLSINSTNEDDKAVLKLLIKY